MKRYLRVTSLSMGAALMVSITALTQPSPDAQAQPAAPSPVAKPAGAAPAPRAGGFPIEMAAPLLAGGAAAVGAGAYWLRRKRR